MCNISAGRAQNTWDGLESGMQLHFYVHFRKESMSTWLPGQRGYQGSFAMPFRQIRLQPLGSHLCWLQSPTAVGVTWAVEGKVPTL